MPTYKIDETGVSVTDDHGDTVNVGTNYEYEAYIIEEFEVGQ